jgi:hypothetical protein
MHAPGRRFGDLKVRLAYGRMRHTMQPEIYAVGEPTADSVGILRNWIFS